MSAPTAYKPPPTSIARELVEAFFTLFVGVFLQVGRVAHLLVLKARRATARRVLFGKAVSMGRRMEQAGAGDQLVRQRLQAIPDGAAREPVLAHLGELGLETGVPILGLKEDYEAGHEAYRRCRQAEYDHDETAYRVLPHSALGWSALLGSYALTAFALLLLVAWIRPNLVPGAIARLVHRSNDDGAMPEVRFDDVQVEVIGARIGRTDAPAGGGAGIVLDERPLLILRLRITNRSFLPIEYVSWRGKFKAIDDIPAKVNDDRGTPLHRIVNPTDTPPEDGIRQATIPGGGSVEDVLVYEAPQPAFKRLDIFLPGESIGKKGETKQLSLKAEQVRTAGSRE